MRCFTDHLTGWLSPCLLSKGLKTGAPEWNWKYERSAVLLKDLKWAETKPAHTPWSAWWMEPAAAPAGRVTMQALHSETRSLFSTLKKQNECNLGRKSCLMSSPSQVVVARCSFPPIAHVFSQKVRKANLTRHVFSRIPASVSPMNQLVVSKGLRKPQMTSLKPESSLKNAQAA